VFTRATFARRDLIVVAGCIGIGLLVPPTRSADSVVTRRVQARLSENPAIARRKLRVAVTGRVATITGQIEDSSQAERALAIVSATPGVMDVIADLRLSDDVITRSVIASFRADPAVAAVPVSVQCVDGEVTLRSDQTNDEQRKHLVRLAAAVDGVVHVVDAMK